jgi:hypothetical protein
MYTPQRLKARGLTLISILISLDRGERRAGVHDLFAIETCKGGLHQLLEQGRMRVSSKPLSIPAPAGYVVLKGGLPKISSANCKSTNLQTKIFFLDSRIFCKCSILHICGLAHLRKLWICDAGISPRICELSLCRKGSVGAAIERLEGWNMSVSPYEHRRCTCTCI